MNGRNATISSSKKVGFSLPEETVEEMRKTSRKTGLSQSKIVTELLDKCLGFFTEKGLELPVSPIEVDAEEETPQAPAHRPPVQLPPEQLVPDPTAILARGRQEERISSSPARQEDKRSHLYQIAVDQGYEREQDVPGGIGTEAVDKYGRVRYHRPAIPQTPGPPAVQQAAPFQPAPPAEAEPLSVPPGGPGYTGSPVNTNPGYTGPPGRQPAQQPPQQQIAQPAQQPQIARPGYTRDPFAVEMVRGGTPGAGALRPVPTVESLLGGDMPGIGTPNPNMEAARRYLGADWRRNLRAQTLADRRED